MSANRETASLFGQNPLRALWGAETLDNLGLGISARDPGNQMPLGWILGSAAIILVIVVGLVAYMAIERSEKAMSKLLAEKGASLLMVFESALKTGMRANSGLQLQPLLEEMATSPDIKFVAVTMPDGVIIAHSKRTRIGEVLRAEGEEADAARIARLAPGATEKWQILRMEGQRVFLIYRHFTLGETDWTRGIPPPTIFLGLDVSPFEITSSQNRSYVIMLSVVTMLVGLACLLALCYSQRAAESRRRQHRAEGEVHRLEQEVRRTEKMAAVGTLAAGVAHEIRNPLSSIKGYATYFRQRFPEGSDDQQAAAAMVDEVNRLNRVITDLLGLSRPSDVKLRPVNVKNIAEHVIRLIRQNASQRHVSLELHSARHVPPVMGDMERLSQALLNLCLNALDAMPNGGKLTVAVSGGTKRICIAVRDTGVGIPEELLVKIFDPYFTTKGNGTGLGLAVVHKIIRAHNGEVDVRSWQQTANRPGDTIFLVWLPVA